jgi:hypothetical protein
MKGSKSFSTATDETPLRVVILDKASGSYIDVLKIVVQMACPKSHIPEIYEVFGRDQLLKFLDIFSGLTFKVPTRELLEKYMRDVVVYLTLFKAPPTQRGRAIKALAKRYETTAGDIRSTFVRLEKAFKEQKLQA